MHARTVIAVLDLLAHAAVASLAFNTCELSASSGADIAARDFTTALLNEEFERRGNAQSTTQPLVAQPNGGASNGWAAGITSFFIQKTKVQSSSVPVQSNAATQEGGSFESLFEERRKLHEEEYRLIRQSDMAKNPHRRLAIFREAHALQPQINGLNRKITSMLVQGPKNK